MVENNSEIPDKKPAKRRFNSLFIFGLFATVIFAISYKPSIETIYCNTETLSTKPDVVMLGAIWCPYCYKARKYFLNNEISYCEYNIEDNGEGEQMYADINTNPLMPLGIPVLFIGDYTFSGFDQRRIEKALSEIKSEPNKL
ncbi:MAG: glutaredoxin family protein [Gammaproteobacteria bacterium]|nr:glutaredoxin family protein [Gammaproteobacteria bacterium]